MRVNGVVESTFWRDAAGWLIPIALIGVFWMLMIRRLGQAGQNGFMTLGRSKAKVYMEKDVNVRFTDVAGVDEAKEELARSIDFLKTPARFGGWAPSCPRAFCSSARPAPARRCWRARSPGRPACRSSRSAAPTSSRCSSASARRASATCSSRPSRRRPASSSSTSWTRSGRRAACGPVGHEEREQTLNQLLVELDGFDTRVGVILMAATNRPEILDPALLRAGRFDRHVLVDRPDKPARLEILKLHARKVSIDTTADLEIIASMTAGFVGRRPGQHHQRGRPARRAPEQGQRRHRELQEAVERVVAGLEKKNRVLSPEEKKRVAYHELGHALVATALPGADEVHKISIIPRGIAALGYTMQLPTEDRFLMTESELENRVATLLGGRAAEELIYDEVSTGAHDDLSKATDIARSMVKTFGMSPRLGQVSLEKDRRGIMLQSPIEPPARAEYSEQTARAIDDEVRRIIDEQRERVAEILARRRQVLVRAAQLLLAKETISGQELRDLMTAHASEAEQDTGSDAAAVPIS